MLISAKSKYIINSTNQTISDKFKEKGCEHTMTGKNIICVSNPHPNQKNYSWTSGQTASPVGNIPRVKTFLEKEDILGAWKARWGINRMNYRVTPGLYATGQPNPDSPVFVSANYKLSFDILRKNLKGINAWIMVLDTKGINVWCAAGKGTFGTAEIIRRVELTGLAQVVTQRVLILPQLGAPGVAAHEITRKTGFRVIYGPVRAEDIPMFLNNSMTKTSKMQQVHFPLKDRLVLTPIELVAGLKILLPILAVLMVMSLLTPGETGSGKIIQRTFSHFIPFLGVTLVGTIAVPVLLPWIPGPSFAWKGWLLGFFGALLVNTSGWFYPASHSVLGWIANLLMLPALSAYLALNFTGATPFTSLSGVKKEMKIAVPLILASAALGVVVFFWYYYHEFYQGVM